MNGIIISIDRTGKLFRLRSDTQEVFSFKQHHCITPGKHACIIRLGDRVTFTPGGQTGEVAQDVDFADDMDIHLEEYEVSQVVQSRNTTESNILWADRLRCGCALSIGPASKFNYLSVGDYIRHKIGTFRGKSGYLFTVASEIEVISEEEAFALTGQEN